MLTHTQVAFMLVEIEAETLHAKAAAVLHAKPGQSSEQNVILRARLLALRNRVNTLCDHILTGDETKLFLAD